MLKPVTESAGLDVLWYPVDRIIVGQEPILPGSGSYIPGWLRVIQQRRTASPTERVAMLDSRGFEEITVIRKAPNNDWISILEEESAKAAKPV
jgi:hypothetical protein